MAQYLLANTRTERHRLLEKGREGKTESRGTLQRKRAKPEKGELTMERIQTYRSDEVNRVIDQNSGLLLVHFGSPLASSCEFLRKELELLAPRFEGRVLFGEVAPLEDLQLIGKYQIEEIPTLILFRGSTEVERLERLLLPEDLREFLVLAASFYLKESDDS